MRQSNKCGSVRNDEIINLHLGSGAGLASCKTPATLIDSIRPNNQPGKKTKNPEMRSSSQQIVSCTSLIDRILASLSERMSHEGVINASI